MQRMMLHHETGGLRCGGSDVLDAGVAEFRDSATYTADKMVVLTEGMAPLELGRGTCETVLSHQIAFQQQVHGVVAVSYTHLDVYKRQLLDPGKKNNGLERILIGVERSLEQVHAWLPDEDSRDAILGAVILSSRNDSIETIAGSGKGRTWSCPRGRFSSVACRSGPLN